MPSAQFRPLAVQDVRETVAFLKEQAGLNMARRYFDAVLSTANSLTVFPSMGSPCRYDRPELNNLRRWPVKGFERWQLFYFPGKRTIEVARVLHSARNLDAIFNPAAAAESESDE